MAVNHPQWGTICAICFQSLTIDTCVEDEHGVRWDMCKGVCAIQAGIKEKVSNAPETAM